MKRSDTKTDPASSGASSPWRAAWIGGLSILVGVLAGGFTLAWQVACGRSGGVWPAIVTFAGGTAVYLVFSGPGNRKFFLLVPLIILLAVWSASNTRDSSWDGLGAHVERVQLVASGARLVKTPLSVGEGLPVYLCMAVFPAAGLSIESAKWVQIAIVLAGALMLGAAIYEITASWIGSLVAGFLAILQPAVLYQVTTFYQDGILAGAVAILFASILHFFSMPGWRSAIVLPFGFLMVAGAKKIGLAQAAWIFLLFPFSVFFLLRSMVCFRLFLAGILISAPILAVGILNWPQLDKNRENPSRVLTLLHSLVDARDLDKDGTGGIHGGCGEVSPHAPEMFWKRHFAASKRGEDGRGIKPPFWFTRPELDVFSDLTPDLRFGGYGPLYASACFLALIPGVLLLATGSRRQAGWMWILVACLVLIPLTPSWWARWFPQGWWIPFAASVGFLCGPPDWQAKFRWGGWFARLGLLALGLNSLLILIFTVKGYCEAETVIRRQLAFLKTLPSPLVIETGHFAATRFWLDQKNISYSQEKIPGNSASVVLYRTTLRVRLSDEDLKQIEQDPDHLKLLRRHKLLNLPPPSQSGG